MIASQFVAIAAGRGNFVTDHAGWLVAMLICALGLLVIGFADLRRFSFMRVRAIAGVCFRESIRRRVLWITPVAILGVIIVAQLQRPADEQDAIRQTIKFCLIATGMLVVIATMILACTNLPKEIDNRVIYTIVTKPTTRLEIMAGKVLGFTLVAGAILLIMGLFTFAYVELRASRMEAYVAERAEGLPQGDATRATLDHYKQQGLLHAATYSKATGFQEFARPPKPSDPIRWARGDGEGEVLVPFDISEAQLPRATDADPSKPIAPEAWEIDLTVPHERVSGFRATDWEPTPLITKVQRPVDEVFTMGHALRPAGIEAEILGPDKYNVVPAKEMMRVDAKPGGKGSYVSPGSFASLPRDEAAPTVHIYMPAASVDRIRQLPGDMRRIYVLFRGIGAGWIYGASPGSVRVYAHPDTGAPWLESTAQEITPAKSADGQTLWPTFRGRNGMNGVQLRGSADPAHAPLGIYAFRTSGSSGTLDSANGKVPFEMRAYIERSGAEARTDAEDQTRVQVRAVKLETQKSSEPLEITLESNRPAFFSLPAEFVADGNFDLQVRCLTGGHVLALREATISAVASQHSFGLNLLKSLLVLWLLSLLVAVVSVFCSTFVSWPIAVVLTLVILLGRWGVQQLGDTGPGLGRTVITDFFPGTDPATAKTISSSVEGLTSILNSISRVLPDITAFAATDNIDRGVEIPRKVLFDSIRVILMFGMPLLTLGYVFLKKKEVAP